MSDAARRIAYVIEWLKRPDWGQWKYMEGSEIYTHKEDALVDLNSAVVALEDAEAAAFRAKEEAAQAAQAAAAASAAAAAVPEKVINSETTSVERKKWDLESDGTEAGDEDAVRAILKAIIDGVYPIEYCGYNKKRKGCNTNEKQKKLRNYNENKRK